MARRENPLRFPPLLRGEGEFPPGKAGEPPGLAPKGFCPANPLREARDWFPGFGG